MFQGDFLSPLLFCLSILPLSHALGKSTGYRIRRSKLKISILHMLYMDDMKVYAETPAALNETPSVVDRVASAVGMKLGLKKCGTAHLKKGKVLPGPDTLIRNLIQCGVCHPRIHTGISELTSCLKRTTNW